MLRDTQRYAMYFVALLVIAGLAWLLGPVLSPFVGAAILAYMCVSLVDRLSRRIRQQAAVMSRPDSRPTLAWIKCPTLVLTGDEDHTIPSSLSVEMADGIPGAKLVILPDCGHLPQPEQPKATADALVEWLRN